MKVKRALILVLVLASLPVGWALASGGGLEITRFVIGSGGGRFTASQYVVEGTIGQAVTGQVEAGAYHVCSGFWCDDRHVVYLPVILR